ncbi:hypothetical protein K474DRAFT_1658136 [Panus rudis PR-1116 ss-1]|nr:hypothetical protein K474DRAFT_1658136 [Panus rudis PR-1116 ss-1]
MPSSSSKSEDIPLPTLKVAKDHDYAPAPRIDPDYNPKETAVNREDLVNIERVNSNYSSDSTATDTDDDDEFDWNADDDATSQKHPDEPVKAKRFAAIWRGFMKLARPIRTLIIAIIGGGILITPLLVFRLRFNNSPARLQAHAWSLWLAITWAAACVTYLVVDGIPGFILRLIKLFGYSVERLQTTVELTTAVSGWLKLALDVSWMWIALSVIRAAYHPPGSYWTIVNRVMQALFSGALLLLAEKVFLRYVAINFHRKALADRIAENKLGLEALDRLSNAQPVSAKRNPYGAHRKGHKSPGSSLDMLGFGSRAQNTVIGLGESNGSSPIREKSPISPNGNGIGSANKGSNAAGPDYGTNAARKIKMNNAERKQRKRKAVASVIVDGLGEAIGQVALKNSKFNRQTEIGGLYSAGKLARKLFSALSDVNPPRAHLIVEDFYPYFRTPQDAQAAFAVFDKDGNGDISKKEMREAVRRIYRERKALTASLKDVGSVVGKLDGVLMTLVLVIFVFICLLIFNRTNTLASLVPLATIILGFSFIFGHSAQTLFESLIFIFSTHVFDVGDLVMIDDSPMFVREFGLFSTTFRRVDGQEIIAPNSLLASAKLVHNLRRSNSMWETTELMVSYDTPLDVIEQLRIRLQGYVAANNREWSNVAVNIDKMVYQNAIHIIVAMEHRPNWQDWGGRWVRRTAFMRHLKVVLEELDVKYTMPVQPVVLPRPIPSSYLDQPSSPTSPRLRPPPHSRGGLKPRGSGDSLGDRRSMRSEMGAADATGRHLRSGGYQP